MKNYNFIKLLALVLTAVMLCASLTACSCNSSRDRDRDDDETPAESSPESSTPAEEIPSTPPDKELPSVRYSASGHFPANLTRNEYNERGQLVSVTALDIYNLLPDYQNILYTLTRSFKYDGSGRLVSMRMNSRDEVRFIYDESGYTASGYYNKDTQVKITVNSNGILVKEEYLENGEPYICLEYDDNGNLVKETRARSGHEMTVEYDEDSFVFTMTQNGEPVMTISAGTDGEGRPTSVTQAAGDEEITVLYIYDNQGRVSKATTKDSTYQTVYDDYHRTVLTKGSKDTVLSTGPYKYTVDKKYEYDEDGNILTFYCNQTKTASVYEHKTSTYTFTRDGDGFEKTSVVHVSYDEKNNVISTRTEEY